MWYQSRGPIIIRPLKLDAETFRLFEKDVEYFKDFPSMDGLCFPSQTLSIDYFY